MRVGRLISTALTAGVATLAFATPALANSTILINPGNVPTTAAGFQTHQCDANFGGGPLPGQDVWVFVLPGMHATSGDFVSLTATFGANGPITITAALNPGNFSNGGPDTAKAFIITPAGWQLTAASAVVTGNLDPTTDHFNLTHTCPASSTPPPTTPPPTTAPPTTPPPTTAPPATTVAPSGGAGTGGGGSYGVSAMGVGALVVASGAGVGLFVARRRRNMGA